MPRAWRLHRRNSATGGARGTFSAPMNRNRWIGLAAVALVVAAAVGWYAASPYYTLAQMRDAAKANDADRLSAYIDYPALRANVKSEVTARIAAEAGMDKAQSGALGALFGSVVVGPLVDAIVSPAGVRAMLVARNSEQGKAVGKAAAAAAPVRLDDRPVIERRGLSEFAVRSKGSDGAMVFTRHGLGWKLSGVDLPADGGAGPARHGSEGAASVALTLPPLGRTCAVAAPGTFRDGAAQDSPGCAFT